MKILAKIIFFLAVILTLGPKAFCQDCQVELKIFEIKYGNIETAYEIANSLKSSEGKISFDKKSGKLIVFDCPENISHIAAVIKDIDVKERQVEISLLTVETTPQNLINIGVTAEGKVIPEAEFVTIGEFLKTDNNTNIRSRTTLSTLSSIPAVLQTTKDEFIGQEVVVTDKSVVATPLREQTGNSLEILPVVNNDGSIKVIVRPSASRVDEPQIIPQRNVIASVVVNDGDTVAIAGADIDASSREKGIVSEKGTTEAKKVGMFITVKVVD